MILEDITYKLILSTRNKNMTVEERATHVLSAWQEKLLDLYSVSLFFKLNVHFSSFSPVFLQLILQYLFN